MNSSAVAAVALGADQLLDAAPDVVGAQSRRHTAIDLHRAARRDHVLLRGRPDHRRRDRDARASARAGAARRGSIARTRSSARREVARGVADKRLERRPALRIVVERRLAAVEPAEHLDHLQQRVVADVRHRGVAGPALGDELEAKDALLADARRV